MTSANRLCKEHWEARVEQLHRESTRINLEKREAELRRLESLPPMTEHDFMLVLTGQGRFWQTFRPTGLTAGIYASLVLSAARALRLPPMAKAKAKIGYRKGWGVQLRVSYPHAQGCLLVDTSGRVYHAEFEGPHRITRSVPPDEQLDIAWIEHSMDLSSGYALWIDHISPY
jgi:hypothetical protein